jgi:plastocyanin
MRNTLLVGLLALALPACLGGEITGVGEHTHDDGEGGGGGGGGGDGSGGTMSTPRIVASVDKSTVMTELGKTENLTVTITSVNGFAGPVSVTPALAEGSTAVTSWMVTPSATSVDVPANGTATVDLAVRIPTDSASLLPTLTVELGGTSSVSVTSSFNVAKRVTVDIPAGLGAGTHQAVLPINQPLRILTGTQVVFTNNDGIRHIVHASNTGGLNHENTTSGGMPGSSYMVTMSGNATWYCHDHESGTQNRPISVQQ